MPKNKPKDKVVVAMSGGVDSSVAADLLKNQGHDVTGIFLHFWKEEVDGEQKENKCCSTKALMDARAVANRVKIPFYTFNFYDIFKEKIVDNFISEYEDGKTPNPCVRCNRYVKLGLLIERAKELGYSHVASGHYARIKREIPNSKFQIPKVRLFRSKDKDKDQTYFLYALTQEQLQHLLFPLGDYTKDEVRAMAKKAGLEIAEKKDSQEICFISGSSHNDFLKRNLVLKKGPIKILESGKVVGEHFGLPLYTIGQRKGIEIGGVGPFYVAKLDHTTNTLYVVNDANHPAIYDDGLKALDVNWISGEKPELPLKCEAVIRYRHKPVKCTVAEGDGGYAVKFDEPQRAVTPGQSVVFYDGDEVLGGGLIERFLDKPE